MLFGIFYVCLSTPDERWKKWEVLFDLYFGLLDSKKIDIALSRNCRDLFCCNYFNSQPHEPLIIIIHSRSVNFWFVTFFVEACRKDYRFSLFSLSRKNISTLSLWYSLTALKYEILIVISTEDHGILVDVIYFKLLLHLI